MPAKQPSQTSYCILHTIYNRPRNEKTPGESRYVMLFGKGERRTAKKITTSKRIPPDRSSLKCLIQRTDFVTHGWLNCLDGHYTPPDPLLYGWQLEDGVLVLLWFEGDALPEHLTTEENQTSRAIHKSIEHDINSNSSDDNDEDEDSSYELSEESSDEDDGY